MIKITRRTYIEHTTPEEVFAALSDPKGLTSLLPRMRKVELLERHISTARLATHMSLGGIFGTIRCEGDLRWIEPREIVFTVSKPVQLETRWLIAPAVNGTDLQAMMALDLMPLLGPLAQFVPTNVVEEMIGKELEAALAALATRCTRPQAPLRERAAAA